MCGAVVSPIPFAPEEADSGAVCTASIDAHACAQFALTLVCRAAGEDAYKPELYGRSICVERRLTVSPSTTSSKYRLLSQDSVQVPSQGKGLTHKP